MSPTAHPTSPIQTKIQIPKKSCAPSPKTKYTPSLLIITYNIVWADRVKFQVLSYYASALYTLSNFKPETLSANLAHVKPLAKLLKCEYDPSRHTKQKTNATSMKHELFLLLGCFKAHLRTRA